MIEVEEAAIDADHQLTIRTPEGLLYRSTLESERFAGVYTPDTAWTVTIEDGLGNEMLRDTLPSQSWQGGAAAKFVVDLGPDGELMLEVETIDQTELNALLESWATLGTPGPENP